MMIKHSKHWLLVLAAGLLLVACDLVGVSSVEIDPPASEVSQSVIEAEAVAPTVTDTPASTPTDTDTPTLTATATHSPTLTPTYTDTPAPTPTDTDTPTLTATVTDTPVSETAHLPELPAGGVYGEVTEVHDGDTIWVQIEGESFKVRYIGINAPEIGDNLQPFGNEATEYNHQLVENQTVYLIQDVSDTDQYDRLLRYVFVGDVFVNAELVRVGLARAKNYPPDTRYSDFLFSMQDAAQAAQLNIWSQ